MLLLLEGKEVMKPLEKEDTFGKANQKSAGVGIDIGLLRSFKTGYVKRVPVAKLVPKIQIFDSIRILINE